MNQDLFTILIGYQNIVMIVSKSRVLLATSTFSLDFILSYAEGTARAAVAEGEARRRRPAAGRSTELARESQ